MNKKQTLEACEQGEGCLGESAMDEPIFVLCARDGAAPDTIRSWAMQTVKDGSTNVDKVANAFRLADEMETWKVQNEADQL